MDTDFDVQRLAALLDRYGAESAQWPVALRKQALALIESSVDARRLFEDARLLEDALDAVLADTPVPLGLKTRILANARPRDPWLDWFTVRIWRPAALACLPLAVGFAVGTNFADDAADLEDRILIAFADASTLEALALPEDE